MGLARKGRGSWRSRAALGVITAIAAGCAILLFLAAATSTLGLLPRPARWGLVTVAAASHAAIYIGITLLFGRSLAPGKTPLVGLMASQVHPLTPRIRAYTRRVTVVWMLFGIAQLVTSALLLSLAPLRIWSLFVNGLDLPLVLLLFLAEYSYRRLRFPSGETASFAETLRVTRSRVLR
jgi:uncharacterized membrane protein